MKAWLLAGPEQLVLHDLREPEPKADEALVCVKAVGVCGSDIEAFAGTHPQPVYPWLLGREFAGVVAAAGKQWQGSPVGTRVAVNPARWCGQCYVCRKGRHNCCADLSIAGVHRPGGLAEYALCRAEQLIAIPPEMSFAVAAVIETLSIGAHVARRTQIESGDRVVVLGAGPVGLCCLMMARLQGAEVLVAEPLHWRRTLATEAGAAACLDPSTQSLDEAVGRFTDGHGAHVVIDATGEVEAAGRAFDLVGAAGRVLILAISAEPIQIRPWQLTRQELTVLGSRVSLADFRELVALVTSGEAPVHKLITHRYTMDQAEAAFHAVHTRVSGLVKAVILPC